MKTSRTAGVIAATIGSCALGLASVAPAAAAAGHESRESREERSDQATVSVFHAIPDVPVDVYADGEELLSDFTPGTLTDPLKLDPGSYDIEVFEAGADPGRADPLLQRTVEAAADSNSTVVAYLSEEGDPRLKAFANDTSTVERGRARLTVRHVAAAPAVDVRADGEPLFQDLTNPEQKSAVVPDGTVNADVTLAGTDEVVIGPTDLDLPAGTHTIVYAWGSAEEDSLALKVQRISKLHAKPNGMPSAANGSAASGAAGSPLGWTGAAAVAAVAPAGALMLRARPAPYGPS